MRDQFLKEVKAKMEERFPEFDHSTLRLAATLTNTYHIMLSVMERALASCGITPQSMDVLIAIYVNPRQGCTMVEISDRLMLSPVNITGLVEGLVRKGLVDRREHPVDRRKRLVELTAEGTRLLEAFIPESSRFFETVLAPLTLDEKLTLCDRLNLISTLLLPYWQRRIMPDFRRPGAAPAEPKPGAN